MQISYKKTDGESHLRLKTKPPLLTGGGFNIALILNLIESHFKN